MNSSLIVRQPVFNDSEELVSYEFKLESKRFAEASSLFDIGLTELPSTCAIMMPISKEILPIISSLDLAPAVSFSFTEEDAVVDILGGEAHNGKKFVVPVSKLGVIVEIVDNPANIIVKIDVQSSRAVNEFKTVKRLGCTPFFYNVDSKERFDEFYDSRGMYSGYYFLKGTSSNVEIPSCDLDILKLLNRSIFATDVLQLEELIHKNPSVMFALLKYINSPSFGFVREIDTLSQGLNLLGLRRIQTFLAVVCLSMLSSKSNPHMLSRMLHRGRFMENVAAAGRLDGSANYFIIGVFSLLPSILGKPLSHLLAALKLPPVVRSGLTDIQSSPAKVLQLVQSYEEAEWGGVGRMADILDVEIDILFKSYKESLAWADAQPVN